MVQNRHYALAREAILRSLVAYTGITTADGAAPANNTLICNALIGSNDYISDKTILILSGDARGEDSGASAFVAGSGTITVVKPFNAQILAGTVFMVLNISSIEIDVATINTKIGTNVDAAGTTTLFARLRQIVDTYLASGVFGLAALQADIGDASGSTLGNLYAILGNPAQSFLAMVGYEGATALANKLTAARAGYLDELDFDLQGTLVAIAAYIDTEVAAIKTQTDKLAGAAPSVGTATENWNAAEADIVSIGANDTKNKLHSLVVDISTLTAAATITIRMYMQVNGAEKKVYDQDFVVGTDPGGLWIVNGTVGIHEVLRVTAQSDNAGDDGLAIAYDYMLEAM